MNAVCDTGFMAARHLRATSRLPYFIVLTLLQPMVYLLLFSALFQRVTNLPGFETNSYKTYLTPGVVVFSALFTGGWTGISIIEDLDRGILDRFLVTPSSRIALIAGRVVHLSVLVVLEGVIIVLVALAIGARFDGGVVGILLMLLASILLAAPFGALSCGVALLARRQESVIGVVNLVQLPLTFMSSAFMARTLLPGWMQSVSKGNPVEWAVAAAREAALGSDTDWTLVLTRLAALLSFGAVSAALATRAFTAYQRSI